MYILMTSLFLILLIPMLLILLLNLISKKSFIDREKSSPFECGFDPMTNPRLPFSLNFFLITLIFLIFDVEIILLLPFIMIMKISNILWYLLIFMFFIMILIIGLLHEWYQGALDWKI